MSEDSLYNDDPEMQAALREYERLRYTDEEKYEALLPLVARIRIATLHRLEAEREMQEAMNNIALVYWASSETERATILVKLRERYGAEYAADVLDAMETQRPT